jgi:hypothetical protein
MSTQQHILPPSARAKPSCNPNASSLPPSCSRKAQFTAAVAPPAHKIRLIYAATKAYLTTKCARKGPSCNQTYSCRPRLSCLMQQLCRRTLPFDTTFATSSPATTASRDKVVDKVVGKSAFACNLAARFHVKGPLVTSSRRKLNESKTVTFWARWAPSSQLPGRFPKTSACHQPPGAVSPNLEEHFPRQHCRFSGFPCTCGCL